MGVKKKLVKTILDADNAKRLKRAADQGFDVNNPVFHGSKEKIKAFDKSRIGSTDEGWLGEGFYFSPYEDVAQAYGKNTTEAYLSMRNPFVFPDDVNPIKFVKEKGGSKEFTQWLRDEGYDGVVSDNILVQRMVLEPDQIRSTNAKFDPANIGKNDLMGSVDPKVLAALGVAGAGAALASPDAEAGVKKKIADTILDPDNAKQALKKRQAYHGTPHDFDAFDLKKIGTGEGAQAYGHGLYFSGKKEIAEYYRDALAKGGNPVVKKGDFIFDPNNELDSIKELHQRLSKEIPDLEWDDVSEGVDSLLRMDNAKSARREIMENMVIAEPEDEAIRDRILRVIDSLETEKPGRLYTVDIPDESHMLDWDKPLSEQPESVRNVLEAWQKDVGGSISDGEGALREIAFNRRMNGLDDSPAAVSRQLKEMGIPGITYKGGSSGERNFVVFDDELVDIKEKGFIDPKVLAALGLGSGAAAAIKPGAGNYAAATLQGIGHMPKMMTEELARFGGYANSGLHQILSGKSSPFPVENVDRDAKAMNDWYWKMAEKSALTPTIYNRLNEKAATEVLNPKTEAAKANILQGAGGFANQLIEEVGPTREGQAIKSAYNTLVPIYRKLPKSIRGLLESM